MAQAIMDGFSKLNDITSIYRPTKSSTPRTSTKSPDLIVLCSWMGAAQKHIAKYTDGYRRLFPETSILLIEASLPKMFLGSDLTAACEILDSFLKDAASDSSHSISQRIVLVTFSNGGGFNTAWLAERLFKTYGRLPFDRVILDSCPGQAELISTTRAITLSLPNQYLLRLIAPYLVYMAMLVYKVITESMGVENTISWVRRVLNDETMFSPKTPRLYLYSEGDALVYARDVHAHAEEARQRGFTATREEKFLKAPHCALLNEDSDRYWNAVKAHITSSDDEDRNERN